MNARRIICIVVSFLISMATLAAAQQTDRGDTLTLREAVMIALQEHPRIDQARQRIRMAQAQTNQATADLLPQVESVLNGTTGSARTNTSFQSGAIIENPNSTQGTIGARFDQLIYDFGRTVHRIQARALEAEAREHDYAAGRALTAFRVERAYIEALKRRELLEIAKQTIEEREVVTQLVRAQYTQGQRAKIDLSLAEVELSQARFRLSQAKNDFEVSLQTLRNAMGLEGTGAFHLMPPGEPEENLRILHDLMKEARIARPELRALQQEVESRRAAVTSAERQRLPRIGAIASTGQTGISDQTGKWWYGGFGIVSIPLFTGGRIQGEISEARAARSETEARLRQLRQEIELQVATAYHTYQAVRENVAVARQQVKTSREALELTRERLRHGLGSIVEVTQAQVGFTRAATDLANARHDLISARAALDYTTGETLAKYGIEMTP